MSATSELDQLETLVASMTDGRWKAEPPGYRGDTVTGYLDPCARIVLDPDTLDSEIPPIEDLEESDARGIAMLKNISRYLIDALRCADDLEGHTELCKTMAPTRGCTCGWNNYCFARDRLTSQILKELERWP